MIRVHQCSFAEKKYFHSFAQINLSLTKDYGKLNKIYKRDYVNGCEYKDGNLEFISTSEGKVVSGSTAFVYVYKLKDHLGNVRVSFSKGATGNAEIVQQDYYYPFGMRMANLSENDGNDNSYLYNNKEFENDHNLSWYHYGARYYDPQICRWLQVDPADEFYSAYVYCHNDPVNFVDPDGRKQSYSENFLETLDSQSNSKMSQRIKQDANNAPNPIKGFGLFASVLIHAGGTRAENAYDLITGEIDEETFDSRSEQSEKLIKSSGHGVQGTSQAAVYGATTIAAANTGSTGFGVFIDGAVSVFVELVNLFSSSSNFETENQENKK